MAFQIATRFALVSLLLTGAGLRADPPTKPTKSVAFEKDRLYLYQLQDFTRLKIGGNTKEVEYQAYCDVTLHAHAFTADELSAAARKDVAYANLMAADERLREDVRFELIQIEGRLKRLKRIGTFPQLREAGIAEIYEAWIFPNDRAEPICVHLTDPPTDIEPELDITPSKPVRVCGYFFKVIGYQSNEPNPNQNILRRAPLLIGRTLEPIPPLPRDDSPSGLSSLISVLFMGVGVVLVAIIGMTVWLRRTDAGVRMHANRSLENPFDSASDGPQPNTMV